MSRKTLQTLQAMICWPILFQNPGLIYTNRVSFIAETHMFYDASMLDLVENTLPSAISQNYTKHEKQFRLRVVPGTIVAAYVIVALYQSLTGISYLVLL